MANKKEFTMPHMGLLGNGCDLCNNFTKRLIELNNKYLEQAMGFMQINLKHIQSLYEVSTPDELAKKINEIVSVNGIMFTESLVEDFDLALNMYAEFCHLSAHGSDKAQTEAFEFYDFYGKLFPNPFRYKIDDTIKNTVARNKENIYTINKTLDNATDNLKSAAKSGADTVKANLNKLNHRKQAKKTKSI